MGFRRLCVTIETIKMFDFWISQYERNLNIISYFSPQICTNQIRNPLTARVFQITDKDNTFPHRLPVTSVCAHSGCWAGLCILMEASFRAGKMGPVNSLPFLALLVILAVVVPALTQEVGGRYIYMYL